jgi:hypothetical protein
MSALQVYQESANSSNQSTVVGEAEQYANWKPLMT